MASTWVVMCPNWKSEKHVNNPHGWSLSKKDLVQVGNDYFVPRIERIACHDKFSLQEGVKEAFMSNIPFVVNDFQYNARENGKVEVDVGQSSAIDRRALNDFNFLGKEIGDFTDRVSQRALKKILR